MNYYEFVLKLGRLIGLEPCDIEHAPANADSRSRITAVELFWHGLHEGRYMRISKVISDTDAPELFAAFRAAA